MAEKKTKKATEKVERKEEEQPKPEDTEVKKQTDESKVAAKAGKRSPKAAREADEKQAKEDRKTSKEEAETQPKKPLKPTRSRLERKGKGFKASATKIDNSKTYSVTDATKLAKETSHVKFDATVELHVNLGVDPKHADQNVRDTLVLPAGSGKKVRIAVLTEDAAAAKTAGADLAGTDELITVLDKGTLDFDVLIATPNLMPKLAKYARVLGPKGLMPNPKSGTVTNDVSKAVKEAKGGRVEYRVDANGIVHMGVGKVSFTEVQLADNVNASLDSIKGNKPSSVKGTYIKSIYLTTSMGPSIKIDGSSL